MSLTICLSSEAWHKKLFSADLADWLVSSSGGPSGRGQQRRPVFGRLRARHDLDEVLMPIASRRYAGGRGLLVTPLLNGGIQVASRGLDLREAVVLVLTGFRVEQTVMGQAHPCQVVFCPVGSIPIEMSNLAVLFFQVAIQVKTEHAPSAAVDQNRCFAVHRDILSRRFLLDRHRRLYTGRYHSVQRGCEPSPNPGLLSLLVPDAPLPRPLRAAPARSSAGTPRPARRPRIPVPVRPAPERSPRAVRRRPARPRVSRPARTTNQPAITEAVLFRLVPPSTPDAPARGKAKRWLSFFRPVCGFSSRQQRRFGSHPQTRGPHRSTHARAAPRWTPRRFHRKRIPERSPARQRKPASRDRRVWPPTAPWRNGASPRPSPGSRARWYTHRWAPQPDGGARRSVRTATATPPGNSCGSEADSCADSC